MALVILLGAAAAGGRMLPEFTRPIARVAGDSDIELRILTANVWRENADPAATIAQIRDSGADVVLLQETHGRIRGALQALAGTYPYRSRCWSPCGLTILSKRPFIKEKYRFRDANRRPYGPKLHWARLIAPDGRPVTLITLHYAWPLPRYRQDIVRAGLASALADQDKSDLILAGDMNLTPWSTAMREQDRALAPMVRHSRGLATFPARLHGEMRAPFPFPFLAIDQLYAGPAWRQVSITRLPRAGSDHYAVLAVLRRQ